MANKALLYYTLFTREDDGKWYPQFGDFDRSVVRGEVESYRNEYKAKDLRIIPHNAALCDVEDLIAIANT